MGPDGPQRTLRMVNPRVCKTDLVQIAIAADSFSWRVLGEPRRNLIVFRTFLTQWQKSLVRLILHFVEKFYDIFFKPVKFGVYNIRIKIKIIQRMF